MKSGRDRRSLVTCSFVILMFAFNSRSGIVFRIVRQVAQHECKIKLAANLCVIFGLNPIDLNSYLLNFPAYFVCALQNHVHAVTTCRCDCKIDVSSLSKSNLQSRRKADYVMTLDRSVKIILLFSSIRNGIISGALNCLAGFHATILTSNASLFP